MLHYVATFFKEVLFDQKNSLKMGGAWGIIVEEFAGVAQSVEQQLRNLQVARSIRVFSSSRRKRHSFAAIFLFR